MMVAYTQFASNQHPAAGYSVRASTDAAGSIRDATIYKAGEDYYHKTFSTATGRNRWGDFSTAQVDPSDDKTLWAYQEYGKTRTGTDDGNTGSNSSKWSNFWAALTTVTIDPGRPWPKGTPAPPTRCSRFASRRPSPSQPARGRELSDGRWHCDPRQQRLRPGGFRIGDDPGRQHHRDVDRAGEWRHQARR